MPIDLRMRCGTGLLCGTGFQPCGTGFQPVRRTRRGALFAITIYLASACTFAQTSTAAASPSDDGEDRYTVILASKVITVSGKDIDNGIIVLRNGKVSNVGRSIEYPRNARVIDAHDKVVMPGLINPHTRYGLPRFNRSGVNGQATVAEEFRFVNGQFDELLDAGFTTVALVPSGGGISGRAMVVRTAGDPSVRTLSSPGYLEVSREKVIFRGALERAQQEIEKVEKAKKEWEDKQKAESKPADSRPASAPSSQPPVSQPPSQPASAPATTQASQPAFKPPPIDPAHQPLVDLIEKKEGILALIELQNASDFLHFSQVLKKHPIAHAFTVRNAIQTDFFRVFDQFAEAKPRVIVMPQVSRMPLSFERVSIPRDLSKVGCEVSLMPLNDSGLEHQRILARAADLVREGWTREDALKALTLHPARLLGLDKRVGTIEIDREADFIFLDADPLSGTASVRGVMIAGEMVYEAKGTQ